MRVLVTHSRLARGDPKRVYSVTERRIHAANYAPGKRGSEEKQAEDPSVPAMRKISTRTLFYSCTVVRHMKWKGG